MQLKKEDMGIVIGYEDEEEKVLLLSKFQEVIAFYNKYSDDPKLFCKENPELYFGDTMKWYLFKQSIDNNEFHKWLFNYCFVEGLK